MAEHDAENLVFRRLSSAVMTGAPIPGVRLHLFDGSALHAPKGDWRLGTAATYKPVDVSQQPVTLRSILSSCQIGCAKNCSCSLPRIASRGGWDRA